MLSCFHVAITPDDTNNTVLINGNLRGSNISIQYVSSPPNSPQYKLYPIAAKKPEKNITSEKTKRAKESMIDSEIILWCLPR
jgi:hypothetical protein